MARRLKGVLAPVVTPFDADLKPSAERLITHCKWLVSQNAGLAVFGTNSEANSLSVAERMTLMSQLVEAGVDASLMMPGTGCCALTDTVELTKHAVKLGCSGVLMLPPFFYKNLSDDGLYRAFSETIQRVGSDKLRLYLYHIPPIAQVPITPGVIERLLKAYPGTVAGIKDSSGDWNNTDMLLKNFQSESFDVFCGSEVFLLQTLRGGGAGAITATCNVNPAMIHDLYAHWQDADADDRQAKVTTVRRTFEMLPLISAMKAVIAWKRNDPQWSEVRPPLMSVPKEKLEPLREKLDEIGYQMNL
ncbi:dihydrodipicolinate synthase family protein [Propionivibrio dicarboxylicus]|uniref:4-hydroxy-tetrahydrodipicolinate synthase n=1 Tax=Propionivibrio dicarboxylicus TaxID=83767 RepID=A0A1G7Z4X1_9RHOO|nr:dihydrodipicolinate synthase family protein [Propionivibrio dicarboxylicus]SDH03724.1 4-hydroxy-tetrahydrodipicolinate synthase [Propionivibrio dicarboxylicus]